MIEQWAPTGTVSQAVEDVCPYRQLCGDGPWPQEIVDAIHQERRIVAELGRPLGPFRFSRASLVALWSLRVYLIFMVGLLVWRLLG